MDSSKEVTEPIEVSKTSGTCDHSGVDMGSFELTSSISVLSLEESNKANSTTESVKDQEDKFKIQEQDQFDDGSDSKGNEKEKDVASSRKCRMSKENLDKLDGLTKNKKKRPAAGNDDSKSTDEDSGSPFAELPTEYSSRKKDVVAGRKRVRFADIEPSHEMQRSSEGLFGNKQAQPLK